MAVVQAYYFTSNTGIENALFAKQKSKLAVSAELRRGPMTNKVSTLRMKDITRFLRREDNVALLRSVAGD